VGNQYLALILGFVPAFLFNVYLGNSIATAHALVGSRMRATASAILFFILNFLGLGLGPSSVGFLSDYLEPTLGIESLRYSILILLPAMMFFSACLFFLAGRSLREDLANAPE
jgi:hypothetical protein